MKGRCEMQEIIMTNHGRQRIKERCGVRKSCAEKVAERAQQRGVERSQTKGSLRKWLDEKYISGEGENGTIWIYQEKAFIFTKQNVLVTVLQLPAELARKAKTNTCN